MSLRLIPFVFLLYVCAYIDRANLSFAALQMNRDLRFSGAVYGFGAGIFYIGYALLEVPSNAILARVGARRWIARIMITWGLLATLMLFVRTSLSFYTLRFLLGAAEAGFFPGVIYYFGEWFPANARARALSRFMLGIPVAGIVGGFVAGPLLQLNGHLGLAGWQWLFLVEGLPSVVLGVVALAVLTDRPEGARWLDPAQRDWLVAQLKREREQCRLAGHASFGRALRSARVWAFGGIWAAFYLSAQAYIFWAPQLLKGLMGWSAGTIGMVVAAIALTGGAAILLNGAHSDHTGERWLHAALPLLLNGVAWLAVAAGITPVSTVVALGLASITCIASYGPFWCLPTTFLAGDAAAAGLALVSSLGSLGGFVGPNVLGVVQRMMGSQRAGFMVLAVVAFGASLALIRMRAKDHAARRTTLKAARAIF